MAALRILHILATTTLLFHGHLAYGEINVSNQEILARLEALENQGKKQSVIIANQQAQIIQQNKRLLEQENRILQLEEIVDGQAVEKGERVISPDITNTKTQDASLIDHIVNTAQEEKTAYLKKKRGTLKNVEQYSDSLANSARNEKTKQSRFVLDGVGPVAFHSVVAVVGEVPHLAVDQHVMFPSVLLNVGGGYHEKHSLFIAPRVGIYIFSTSVMTARESDIEVVILKNGNHLAGAIANEPFDQGSTTIVTQLDVGDEVWVGINRFPNASLWGEGLTSFMGCLIM